MLKRTILRLLAHLVVALFLVGVPILSGVHAQQVAQPQITPLSPASASSGGMMYTINYFVVQVIGSISAFVGLIFDWFIVNFIVNFGYHYRESSFGYVIDGTWSTVRDIFNLTFIFGLVYIGFQIILGINDSQAKRTIGFLILAALLVNFSLFITKFIVDFSNIAAVEVYNLFQSNDTVGINTNIETVEVSISQAFVNALGMSSLFGVIPGSAQLLYIFCVFIVFLVLIYVFLAGAVLIAIRFAALCLYMVFSPIMFIGWVFPNMAKYSTDFWRQFLGQAFFAPALLFMLYLSYSITNSFGDESLRAPMGNLAGAAESGSTETWTSSILTVFPFFILTVVFLVASLIVAKRMGAYGANTAITIGNSMQKGARNALWAGTGGAAAGGLGYLGYKKIDRMATSENRAARLVGRTATYLGARDAAEKKYKGSLPGKMAETRNKRTTEMSVRDAEATRQRDIDAGTAITGELAGLRDRRRYAEIMAKQAAGATLSEDEKTELNSLTSNGTTIPTALAASDVTRLDALEKIEMKMASAVTDLSGKQLENMGAKERAKIAGFLTESQVEGFMKSDKVSESDKGALMKVRKEAVKNMVERNGQVLGEAIGKLSIGQIETLGEDWINSNAEYLTTSQLDDLKKSKKFTESQKGRFTTSNKNRLSSLATTGTDTDIKRVLAGKKPADKARLGLKMLRNTTVIKEHIDKDVLHEILKNKTLNEAERQDLSNKIRAVAASGDANATRLLGWLSAPDVAGKW